MAEHIRFEMDLKPVEEGLPDDHKVYWVRRVRGCLRQAVHIDGQWQLWPMGTVVKDVTHYGRPPEMESSPCDEQREVIAKYERHN